MKIENTTLEGVKIIHQFHAEDQRGLFVKTFHQSSLKNHDIDFELKESFYSISKKDVIRGMHFHHPPHEHAKIVFCTQGSILDVALDLRKESVTYGQSFSTELSYKNHKALYIPKGFAHGFLTLSEQACTFYLVDGEYNSKADDGILYSSIDLDWKIKEPLLSKRDTEFVSLNGFKSPF